MKKVIRALPLTIAVLLLSATIALACRPDQPKKVTYCHAKPPATAKNGWNMLTTNVNSIANWKKVVNGHGAKHKADIIPAFKVRLNDKVYSYAGKNLATMFGAFTGQEILDNGCVKPPPPYKLCDEQTPWRDVKQTSETLPNGDILITTYYEKYDARDPHVVCDRKTVTETIPYEMCTKTTDFVFSERIFVRTKPNGDKVYSDVYLSYDFYNSENVCGRRAQIVVIPYEACKGETDVEVVVFEGPWSDWVYDPATDSMKRTRTVVTTTTYTDVITKEVCDEDIVKTVEEEFDEYFACEGETYLVYGPWSNWKYESLKDRRYRIVEVRDVLNDELCGTFTERQSKCKDLFKMWFLRNEEGDECFLISDTHPSVERQNQLCRPCTNPGWTSVKSWSGMVNSCDEWEMDKYISLSRLPVEELIKVNDRHTGKECRLPLQTCP